RPRAALHRHRIRDGHLRPRREPALAEPPVQRVGGADLLLRHRLLARAGRERQRVPHQGDPRHRHGPPRAAVLGDRDRRPSVQGRGRGRRGRPVAPLGLRPGEPQRAQGGRQRVRRRRPRPCRAAGWLQLRRGAVLMKAKARSSRSSRDNTRRVKKKTSILVQEQVTYVDWKDVNLLRRFMSDRAKIRARRVTGNDTQQQRQVAHAIKLAREMALLPYTSRVTTQRGRQRRDDDERRPRREEQAPSTAAAEELTPPPEGEGATAEAPATEAAASEEVSS